MGLRPAVAMNSSRTVANGAFRQCNLGSFSGARKTRQRAAVFVEVNPVLPLKLLGDIVYQHGVKIIASELCVSVRGKDFYHAGVNFNDGNVKGAPAKIIYDGGTDLLRDPIRRRAPRLLVR